MNFFENSIRLPILWCTISDAPTQITLSIQQFLTENGVIPVPHPLYSPDLTLSDFFPQMKSVLRGENFVDP